MPNMPKQEGDAVLCRNGNVKLKNSIVGVWWMDEYRWYHFALLVKQQPILSRLFRHELKTAISAHIKNKIIKTTV